MKKVVKLFCSILIITTLLTTPMYAFAKTGTWFIRQEVNSRSLFPKVASGLDYVVTRSNPNQRFNYCWDITKVKNTSNTPNLYRIKSRENNLYLDAASASYAVYTNKLQEDGSQWWYISPSYFGHYRIKQYSTGRYLDAYESGGYSAVTRTYQNNGSQRWILDYP